MHLKCPKTDALQYFFDPRQAQRPGLGADLSCGAWVCAKQPLRRTSVKGQQPLPLLVWVTRLVQPRPWVDRRPLVGGAGTAA